jgi:small subunit ribosomal protein S3
MGQKSTQQAFACPLAATGQPLVRNNVIFAGMLAEDIKVRELPQSEAGAAVPRVLIERPAKNARITIFSARPVL